MQRKDATNANYFKVVGGWLLEAVEMWGSLVVKVLFLVRGCPTFVPPQSILSERNSAENYKSLSFSQVCQTVPRTTKGGQKQRNNSIKLVGACGFERQTPTVSSSALPFSKSFENNKHHFCSVKTALHVLHQLLQLLV